MSLVGTDVTDAELIEASWSDASRFGDVFRRHYRAVYAYTVRAVGPSDGPDLAAEVFVNAFEARRRYDVAYVSARPWLLGIAAHLVGTYYRSKARGRRATLRLGDPAIVPDFASDAAGRVDAAAARDAIGRALGGLRPAEREVVSLFVFAGLSYREIAQSLGIAEGTVRSRLSRAREKSRNLMAGFDQYTDERTRGD
ncbi:ECF RNA polymerase sigma factor SigE [bacterium BMS3Abin02]|nr:ECF RNA polymerase sigma factor SigE [bacterium BMS3Abin02]HDL50260.1 RNA polymerase sigma factor [Actinomycetota bacterium]